MVAYRILLSVLFLLGVGSCSGSTGEEIESLELRVALASGSPAITAWASVLLAETGVAIDPIYAPEGPAGTTTPPRERLRAARDAQLVILQGAGFAKWAQQAALPTSRTRRLIEKDAPGVLLVKERTHAHGAQGKHAHRGLDGHTWLSPTLAEQQIRALADALATSFPKHQSAIRDHARGLASAQLAARAQLTSAVGEVDVPQGLGMHGHGFGYLAEAWGGSYAEVNFALDQRLSSADWNRLRSQLGPGGAILMVSGAPSAELEQQLRDELQVICVVLESGAEAAPASEWLDARERGINAIEAAIVALFELRE
ncbi:MAG: zinc ABC transporter substrate-binding protein [Planctomycetes bacterium]|nr:zinc ABC transporter substrate-binding protein [Planctomycetota bacterium]